MIKYLVVLTCITFAVCLIDELHVSLEKQLDLIDSCKIYKHEIVDLKSKLQNSYHITKFDTTKNDSIFVFLKHN